MALGYVHPNITMPPICAVDVPMMSRLFKDTGHVRDICGTFAGHPILYPTFSIGRGIGKAMFQPCQAPGNYVLALMVIRPDGSR